MQQSPHHVSRQSCASCRRPWHREPPPLRPHPPSMSNRFPQALHSIRSKKYTSFHRNHRLPLSRLVGIMSSSSSSSRRRRRRFSSTSRFSSSSRHAPPLPTTLALSHVKTTSILLGIYSTFVMSDHHKRPQNPLVEFVNSGS